MKLLKSCLVLMMLAFSVSSSATVLDGNEFLERATNGGSGGKTWLYGYSAGMFDAYERSDIDLYLCLGESVKMTQIVDSIVIYLKNNPQVRHKPMYFIFPEALRKQFNCKPR